MDIGDEVIILNGFRGNSQEKEPIGEIGTIVKTNVSLQNYGVVAVGVSFPQVVKRSYYYREWRHYREFPLDGVELVYKMDEDYEKLFI